jgi:hypothetical protein
LLKLQKHYHPNKILEIPCKEKSEKGGREKTRRANQTKGAM